MSESSMLGAKMRAFRQREGLTQAQLAERLGVSASYLNLIENNRRPLTVKLLLRLAQEFKIDVASFGSNEDARMVAELREVFGDPMFDDTGLTPGDLRELATSSPGAARAVLTLYRKYRDAHDSAESLAEILSGHGASGSLIADSPSEEVSQRLQRQGNHFPELERAAEDLWHTANLDVDNVYGRLVEHLARAHHIEVRVTRVHEGTVGGGGGRGAGTAGGSAVMRRYDAKRGLITLSEILPPRTRRFQLAHQIGLITQGHVIDPLVAAHALSSDTARALFRVVLANYFAAAVLMPYESLFRAATEVRYDIELLAHRYRTSFEQVCHRLTTLSRPGMEGIPLHFIRIDIAGNISKRFSGSGIRMPRFSGACPLWNAHAAFLTPGMFRVQVSRMPDGTTYFCVARTVQRAAGGYNIPHTVHAIGIGCQVKHAGQMVYADGVDLENPNAATPVGVTCRTCERMDCAQRVVPPMQRPLTIDENVRGIAFYAPVPED